MKTFPSVDQLIMDVATQTSRYIPVTAAMEPLLVAIKDNYYQLERRKAHPDIYPSFVACCVTAIVGFMQALPPQGDGPFKRVSTEEEPDTAVHQLFYKHLWQPFDRLGQFFSATQMFGDEFEDRFLAHYAVRVPMPSDTDRFEHHHIMAPQGKGKTTVIEAFLHRDLARVERGEASVFVMDSQQELIPHILNDPRFQPGGSLYTKLVYLEPDKEFPLALNLFDPTVSDSEAMLEMAEFVFASVLRGTDLTGKQSGLFRYMVAAIYDLPNPSLRLFKDLLGKGGYAKHESDILKINDTVVVEFFRERFNDLDFTATKTEIFWRLDSMLSNKTFRQMFSAPENKVNLYDELGSAKVICVNTNLAELRSERTELFGRYFIALLLDASRRRANTADRLPTFCYIDECQNYLSEEPRIADLIFEARKQKVGLVLAHHDPTQITDRRVMAALDKCHIQYIATPERYVFEVRMGGMMMLVKTTPSPFPQIRTVPQHIRDDMRNRYCYDPATLPPAALPVISIGKKVGKRKAVADIDLTPQKE